MGEEVKVQANNSMSYDEGNNCMYAFVRDVMLSFDINKLRACNLERERGDYKYGDREYYSYDKMFLRGVMDRFFFFIISKYSLVKDAASIGRIIKICYKAYSPNLIDSTESLDDEKPTDSYPLDLNDFWYRDRDGNCIKVDVLTAYLTLIEPFLQQLCNEVEEIVEDESMSPSQNYCCFNCDKLDREIEALNNAAAKVSIFHGPNALKRSTSSAEKLKYLMKL